MAINLATAGSQPSLSALGVVGDYTIRRVHARVGLQSLQTVSTANAVQVFVGATVASNDALVVGLTALPDPRVDAGDWFIYGTVSVSESTLGTDRPPMSELVIDSHAMRRVNENNQAPVLLVQAPAALSSDINFSVSGRMLVSHGRG